MEFKQFKLQVHDYHMNNSPESFRNAMIIFIYIGWQGATEFFLESYGSW